VELDTVAKITAGFYRLLGTTEDDEGLVDQGEAVGDIADLYLTRGCRAAQRWMLKCGYGGWRKRSSALTFSGTDAADGGRYVALPSDFLRAFGSQRPGRSALVEANGRRWGREIEPDQDHVEGNGYYIRGDELWLARRAVVPTTLYLDYHYTHPPWDDDLADGDIDFPLEARPLIHTEAAFVAMEDDWLVGFPEMERKIVNARQMAREEARGVARRTKQPRTMFKPVRFANHW
jgi:hypothetical protein